MDYLKVYARNGKDLKSPLQIMKDYSDDIGMEFGSDKYATFKAGKFFKSNNVTVNVNTTIRNLEQADVYRYLGMNEGDDIQYWKMKEKIRKECYRRIRHVVESELNASNRINAITSPGRNPGRCIQFRYS